MNIISKATYKLEDNKIQGTSEWSKQLGIIAGMNVLLKEPELLK